MLEIAADLKDLILYEYEKADEDDVNSVDLKRCLDESSTDPVNEIEEGQYNDKLLFIYTSGTTGMPKAAVITNSRYVQQHIPCTFPTTFFRNVEAKISISARKLVYDYRPTHVGRHNYKFRNCACIGVFLQELTNQIICLITL